MDFSVNWSPEAAEDLESIAEILEEILSFMLGLLFPKY